MGNYNAIRKTKKNESSINKASTKASKGKSKIPAQPKEPAAGEYENEFLITNTNGITLNNVKFNCGIHNVGDTVQGHGGAITITPEIRNSLLSLDNSSIQSNPHLVADGKVKSKWL